MSPQLPDIEVSLPLDDEQQVWIVFRRISRGSFLMGSRGYYNDEEPVHLVEIPFDFYLGKFPVTQRQFAVWTQQARIDHKNEFDGNPEHPAENMNWHEANQFCQWLQGKVGLLAQQAQYRDLAGLQACLPTEAQWEYACSAWHADHDDPSHRIYTDYHTGDGTAALEQAGWFSGNSNRQTQPVGQKANNRHGLHDMHGNVLEWCRDCWDIRAYRYRIDRQIDPCVETLDEGTYRVLRGGSWYDRATYCRAACRAWFRPAGRGRNLGFRVGLFPVPCQPAEQQQG